MIVFSYKYGDEKHIDRCRYNISHEHVWSKYSAASFFGAEYVPGDIKQYSNTSETPVCMMTLRSSYLQ